LQRLVPLEVPVNRANLMITVLDVQRQLALSDLKVAVAAGLVPDQTAPMPASLKAASDTADLINKEYPDKPVTTRRQFPGQRRSPDQRLLTPGRSALPRA
jgi:hypothetical protein